jgi:hypothetical protein
LNRHVIFTLTGLPRRWISENSSTVKPNFPLQLLALLVMVAPVGHAQSVPVAKADAQPSSKYYLALTPEQERALIPPAPAKGSTQDQADLAGVLQAQATRTPAQEAEARRDETFKITLVTSALGPDVTAAKDPVLFALLNKSEKQIEAVTAYLKDYYQRNRPYVDHPEVKNLFPAKNPSYPSGHASSAETQADLLTLLFPAQQAALHARALAIAQSRVDAGVHYPSDIQEGMALGDKVAALLEDNPAFQKDLAAARAEVKP